MEIAGQIGDNIDSCRGVPEGCAFSVVSMTVLTVAATSFITNELDGLLTPMFADNWGLIANDVSTLRQAAEKLEHFVQLLKMKISDGKSWTWATCPSTRKQLHTVTLNNQKVAMKHSAKDLGCDVAYTRKRTKKTLKGRWAKSIRILKRIRQKKLPKQFRKKMCSAMGIGVVAYGTELSHVAKDDMHALRSAQAAVMGYNKAGTNAWMAGNITGEFQDPQMALMMRKIRFYRRFFRIFPGRMGNFLHRLANGPTVQTSVTHQFRQSLADMGWTCELNGVIRHETGVWRNWMTASLGAIKHLMKNTWAMEVSKKINSQKRF